jgi:hypothetical protein
MVKTKPVGVRVFAIWSFLAGILIIIGGCAWLVEYTNAIQQSATDELVKSWLPYFRDYAIVGILWIVSGVGLCISTFGLWNGKAWSKTINILSNGGVVIGWAIIEWISFSFRLPASLLYLVLVLPVTYLFTGKAREYFKNAKNIASL